MERLALYLRLSLEDEGEKDESNSISNQTGDAKVVKGGKGK